MEKRPSADVPFLRAGFNARHRRTGIRAWTRHVAGRRFERAELIQFIAHGDYAWHGERSSGGEFLVWGDQIVLGTRPEFDLPGEWQFALPESKLQSKPGPARKVSFTILGEPASKGNSRELVLMNRPSSKHGGRMVKMPALIKSEKARDYERDALLQIPPSARIRMDCPLRVTIHIFYASARPDLDESVVLDVMQDRYAKVSDERVLVQKGVYRNDRQVQEKHVFHGIDKANPRAEIEVEPLEGPAFAPEQLELVEDEV